MSQEDNDNLIYSRVLIVECLFRHNGTPMNVPTKHLLIFFFQNFYKDINREGMYIR